MKTARISNSTPCLANRPRLTRTLATLAVVMAAGLCGCTMLTYTSANGERFSRTSLGAQTSIASLEVEAGSNGVRRVELRGYQNETAQALGTVTEAAVRAALGSK